MSALMRKTILEDEGGLQTFGKYLAEDYFIAQAVQDRGLCTVISSQPALQNAGDSSVHLFQSRITRWEMVIFKLHRPYGVPFKKLQKLKAVSRKQSIFGPY